ncbi:MAG: TIGR03032 family protein [Alphaproteobacteria bacterium]
MQLQKPTEQAEKAPEATPGQPVFELNTSRQFGSWLAESGGSLALTTYQAGKVILLGTKPDGALNVFNRTLNRCMGMTVQGNSLYISTLTELIRFENAMRNGETGSNGEDAYFVPQMGWYTGDMDIHDMAVGKDGLVFANTLFNCLATPSATHSFKPYWQPPFIDRLAAEDRCHLNGLAMGEDGTPAYVTCISQTNITDGWREHRRDGGVVLDVKTGDVVCSGLSMPHSPRLYQGKLWLHNSGTGQFGYVDFDSGTFKPLTFCPGYLRGLAFTGNYAIAGLSEPRENKTFTGLALQDKLDAEGVSARCGLYVIDLTSGDIVHWARIQGVITELYDVLFLPGMKNPAMVGFQSDEIRRVISIES